MLRKIYNKLLDIYHFKRDIDIQKMLTAKMILAGRANDTDRFAENIQAAEFRVFSQWNDDGIIQFLINYLDIDQKTFIEFGVENYREATTRFLLENNNWKGLILDGSKKNIESL